MTHLALNSTLRADENGFFGEFGGKISHPLLKPALQEIENGFREMIADATFKADFARLHQNYIGRPSPIYHAQHLSAHGAQIYLKREDLNHTGSHKINHCLGEVLLAKRLGKKKVVAETGAGQHGVALATAAALLGLQCEIHMGEVDIAKEHPNVARMKILGAKIVAVSTGAATLKEAVDSAFTAYLQDTANSLFAIGSVVGPAPYPEMVAYFQSVVGHEARAQFQQQYQRLPNEVVACIGGGSNAAGIFNAFLDDSDVILTGVEPGGEGLDKVGRHAAAMTLGKRGNLHGYECYYLQDEDGSPSLVHSIASGLDYPGVGPQHCFLRDSGRANYCVIEDDECLAAFMALSRQEGIIPALESAHAVAYALRRSKEKERDYHILINLSGRGDKDIDFVIEKLKI